MSWKDFRERERYRTETLFPDGPCGPRRGQVLKVGPREAGAAAGDLLEVDVRVEGGRAPDESKKES